MNREDWWAMIEMEWINTRFAAEIESHFGEYPSSAMIEVLFNSDWGRGVRNHFGIDQLRTSEEERALIRQFVQIMDDPDSVIDVDTI
jgi:hypothetical protein